MTASISTDVDRRQPSFYGLVKSSQSSPNLTTLQNSQAASVSCSSSEIDLMSPGASADSTTDLVLKSGDSKAALRFVSASSNSDPSLSNRLKVDDAITRENAARKGTKSLRNLSLLETFDGTDPMVAAAMECKARSLMPGRVPSVRSMKHLETLHSEDLRVSSLMDAHATGAESGRKAKVGKSKSMRQLIRMETLSGEDMLVASVMQAHKGGQILAAAQ